MRRYRHDVDYKRVNSFLIETYRPGTTPTNWLQPRWEYMHAHSLIANLRLDDIGIVEDDGRINGIVHGEHSPATVYFQTRPGVPGIREPMVDWAETHSGGWSEGLGAAVRGLYINDFDVELEALAAGRGYAIHEGRVERHARLAAPPPLEVPPVPDGFTLMSLDETNDLAKIHRVLWRGFNHEGAPPPEGVAERRTMQATPGFRKDLTIVAVAPNGDYACFGGIWYVPENRVAYVEPVATDPDYRRLGLGTAVVLETIRRGTQLGAEAVWVGSDQQFYLAMGFEIVYQSNLWLKTLD